MRRSRGTKYTLDYAREKGKPVKVIDTNALGREEPPAASDLT